MVYNEPSLRYPDRNHWNASTTLIGSLQTIEALQAMQAFIIVIAEQAIE